MTTTIKPHIQDLGGFEARRQRSVEISAGAGGRCIVIGGEPLSTRHKWWNFVSSRPERIERAKQDWLDSKFGQVPEETEFIPLPEDLSLVKS